MCVRARACVYVRACYNFGTLELLYIRNYLADRTKIWCAPKVDAALPLISFSLKLIHGLVFNDFNFLINVCNRFNYGKFQAIELNSCREINVQGRLVLNLRKIHHSVQNLLSFEFFEKRRVCCTFRKVQVLSQKVLQYRIQALASLVFEFGRIRRRGSNFIGFLIFQKLSLFHQHYGIV